MIMKTVKLSDGDLVIASGKPVWLEAAECARQRLINKLRLDKASWFLGPDGGIPWLTIYQQKSVSERLIRSSAQEVLEGDDEVSSVDSITVDFNRSTRRISVAFTASTIWGEVSGTI